MGDKDVNSYKEKGGHAINTENSQVKVLAELLLKKEKLGKKANLYPSIRIVLSVLGIGAVFAGALISPKATGTIIKTFYRDENDDWPDWRKFNESYLRQTLRRLERQKLVEIKQVGDVEQVVLSEKGKQKILSYSIDDLEIKKPRRWDGKWRVVIYDVPVGKRKLQSALRQMLKRLGFLQMQESVYIIPYPCYKEVEFLRHHYFLGEYIKYMLVDKIEDDSVYKTYFGLN